MPQKQINAKYALFIISGTIGLLLLNPFQSIEMNILSYTIGGLICGTMGYKAIK